MWSRVLKATLFSLATVFVFALFIGGGESVAQQIDISTCPTFIDNSGRTRRILVEGCAVIIPVQVEEINMPGITFTVERGERNDAMEQTGNPEITYDVDTPTPEAGQGDPTGISWNDLLPALAAGNNDTGLGIREGVEGGRGEGAGGGNGGQGAILNDGRDYWERHAPPGDCGGMITVGSEGVRIGVGGNDECWDDTWDNLGDGLAEGAEAVGNFFGSIWEGIGEGAEAIGEFFSNMGSSIAGFFTRDPQAPPGPQGIPSNPGFPLDSPGRGPLLAGEVPPKVLINDGGLRFGDGARSFSDNHHALRKISSGNPDATNARTGDPVDLVSGALTLNEGITTLRGVANDFPISLHYDSQRRTQTSLFGAGWDITGNEALYTTKEKILENALDIANHISLGGRVVRECDQVVKFVADVLQVGPLHSTYFGEYDRRHAQQFVFGSSITPSNCWRGIRANTPHGAIVPENGEIKKHGVDKILKFLPMGDSLPHSLEMIGDLRRPQQMDVHYNPPIVMTEMNGTKNYFDNRLILFSRYCGLLDPLSRACLYMLKYYPELMRQFIPIGYYHRGSGLLQNLPMDYMPTHWLGKIELPGGREVVSIERAMTWEGEFVFPGSISCERDLACQLEASVQATAPQQRPVFQNPVPREMTVIYRTPSGGELTLRALWREESAGETGNVMAFHYVPYVVEAWDNNNRHWSFDYVYASKNGETNCTHYWDGRHEGRCDYVLQFRRGPAQGGNPADDLIDESYDRTHVGPLTLQAIHYPNPTTGAATGPVKRFLYDQNSRMTEILNFDGATALSIRYDQYNRVAEQRLGNQGPIVYRVLDEADEDKTFIDDRPLEDSYGHSFEGFEVEIRTAAGDRSIVGIEKGGLIRYQREWLSNSTLLETAYVYRNSSHDFAQGTLWEIYHPGGKVETFVLDSDSNHLYQERDYKNLKRFQRKEHRVSAGETTRTVAYRYHENTDYGFNLPGAVTDPLGRSISYQYDFESQQNRCQTRLGLPAQITYPDGSTEIFEYNNSGQILFHRSRLGAETRSSYHGTGEGCGQ